MFVRASVTSVPNAAACRTTWATLALWISFLLGWQLMFGQDPPIHLRSTTTVRPDLPISHASHLPASPLPMIRFSTRSACAITETSLSVARTSRPVHPAGRMLRRGARQDRALPVALPLDGGIADRMLAGEAQQRC